MSEPIEVMGAETLPAEQLRKDITWIKYKGGLLSMEQAREALRTWRRTYPDSFVLVTNDDVTIELLPLDRLVEGLGACGRLDDLEMELGRYRDAEYAAEEEGAC